jgi:hypothetical protein
MEWEKSILVSLDLRFAAFFIYDPVSNGLQIFLPRNTTIGSLTATRIGLDEMSCGLQGTTEYPEVYGLRA